MIHIAAVSDMFNAGTTEDGSQKIGLVWYVQCELDNGRRFAHAARWYSTKAEFCPELGANWFPDNSEEAETRAEAMAVRIREHLATGGKLDRYHWSEIDPRYGSEAYSDLDETGYFKARERKEDEAP